MNVVGTSFKTQQWSTGSNGRLLARVSDRTGAVISYVKQLNGRMRHYQARRPVVAGLVYGVVVGIAFGILSHSSGLVYATVGGVVYGVLLAALQMYVWRPRGMARRQYEAWCDRIDGVTPRPIVFPGGSPPPGWYQNPSRHSRVRFWNGAQWV